MHEAQDLDQLAVDTIRTLAMDAVQQANSGHPGAPIRAGAGGLHPSGSDSWLRPRLSHLAQPRPPRALRGSCLHAALCAATPERGQGGEPGLRDPGPGGGRSGRIVCSHIGYGSPNKQDTYSAHGSPLGEEEIRLTKRFYGWPEDAMFLVPDEVVAHFRQGLGQRSRDLTWTWPRN